ncbi:MAG: hypothetical protein J6N52_10725 [Clostridia bacterium]|nr:hypothetical protein [Clostridia bacterium]
MQTKKKKQFTYKNKPLFRIGNTIYYGDPGEKYILKLEITETKKIKELDAASKVKIKLVGNTGEPGSETVFRQSERDNLYTALDIGEWWLQTALAQK